jgi:hypothetical protein
MAPRPARPVALDELRGARAKLRTVNLTLARHFTMCARCGLAHGNYRQFCDEGWTLAKQQARAAAAVRKYTEPKPSAPVQETLF